jgi:hypothetical protein
MARLATSECASTADPHRERLRARRRRRSGPLAQPKFGQKLDFIERMTRWSEKLREPTLIVGDFNVAPLECDVWSHKALLNVVSHTPVEVDALNALQKAHDWVDIGRKFVPAPSAASPGGAIAPRTGPRTTAGGGSTICGYRRRSLRTSSDTVFWSRAVRGSGRAIMCR